MQEFPFPLQMLWLFCCRCFCCRCCCCCCSVEFCQLMQLPVTAMDMATWRIAMGKWENSKASCELRVAGLQFDKHCTHSTDWLFYRYVLVECNLTVTWTQAQKRVYVRVRVPTEWGRWPTTAPAAVCRRNWPANQVKYPALAQHLCSSLRFLCFFYPTFGSMSQHHLGHIGCITSNTWIDCRLCLLCLFGGH